MSNPLILYSTNTRLAYLISKRYYGEVYYLWCTPYFDSKSLPEHDYTIPPTSSPSEIYHSLYQEVIRGDRHSAKIRENKGGILEGADAKKKTGVITQQQEAEIIQTVEKAEILDFKPLLYIIPFNLVTHLVEEVPVAKRAHPLSVEYLIKELPRHWFDIITLERS
ncbi:hypothetical protein HYR99_27170 [Candidatus Poribacteria bacterium]|nr:hypothetical protein [Candidatus Poribacteria bacterium]